MRVWAPSHNGTQRRLPDNCRLTRISGNSESTSSAAYRIFKDCNNVTLSFEDNRILSAVGESIDLERDVQGRISETTDPAGNSIVHDCHSTGELASVTGQVFNENSTIVGQFLPK